MSDAVSAAPPRASDRLNVLLVDDQPEGLMSLEAVLQGLGENLVQARSGREALRHVLDTDFAVILLDVQMPGMDGYETAEAIRQREQSRHTPILFLTASHRTEGQVFRGYAAGAVNYLFKPVEPEILRSKVKIFLDMARQAERIRLLNRALERQAAELAVSNHDLEAFAYSVSHDLRAPLRSITGFSRILMDEYGQDLRPEAKDLFGRITASGRRMDELIQALLALSRVTRAEMKREQVDLSAAARSVAEDLRRTAPAREAEIAVEEGLRSEGDTALLRNTLANLLGNAWKYTGKVPRARIEFGAERRADGGRVFFVRDNGAGFDMKYAGIIFAPFQRLHTEKEFEGSGIGLATVQRIVARHGGRIWAEAEPGQGATFYFTLGE